MQKYFLLLLLVSPLTFSATLEVNSGAYDFKEVPEFKAIMAELKPYGAFAEKTTQEPGKEPVARPMSKGEQAVEEAKARNRAILAKMKERESQTPKKKGLEAWKDEVKATHESWKKEIADTRAQWKREQDIFLGRVKVYKENTFELPVKKEKIIEKKVPVEAIPDVHIVNGAFAVPIRDQKDRPTCSAFAGLRAVEIILAQNKQEMDLSEQYFYWASKPNCQSSPCTQKGSWVTPGFRHSMNQALVDVPSEEACAYRPGPMESNETQVPLSAECKQGRGE